MFIIIGLCSCSGGSKREVIRDYPSKAVLEALSLESVQKGESLNKELDKSKAYTDVLISSTPKDTLFYQTIDLNEYLDNRFKQINLRILYFNDQIPSNDASLFMTEMNHKDYGLTEEKVGYTFKKTSTEDKDSLSDTLFGKLSLSYTINQPKDFQTNDEDKATLVVVYLPTYCTYNDGTQDYTKVFILVPVYYAFTHASTVNEFTEGLKEYTVSLTDKGLLPSEE